MTRAQKGWQDGPERGWLQRGGGAGCNLVNLTATTENDHNSRRRKKKKKEKEEEPKKRKEIKKKNLEEDDDDDESSISTYKNSRSTALAAGRCLISLDGQSSPRYVRLTFPWIMQRVCRWSIKLRLKFAFLS